MSILLGDIGIVAGRKGIYCVYAGASAPENIVPCSQSAIASAEPSETLTLTDGSTCARTDFTRLDLATKAQRDEAVSGDHQAR